MTQPLQIISCDDDTFELKEENLDTVFTQIPAGMKVSVVSVVGAFRTGKSFLLNFFLRYLRHSDDISNLSDDWMTMDGEELAEGNNNVNDGIDEAAKKKAKESSFAWRGGQERQTTGIWMWSEPFIRKANNGEKIAVLLMDTQGMFDNETTMTLTAQIFGLSTLVSSYQIYNVDKRIQEDNLQHLALFSEYGRMATEAFEKNTGDVTTDQDQDLVTPSIDKLKKHKTCDVSSTLSDDDFVLVNDSPKSTPGRKRSKDSEGSDSNSAEGGAPVSVTPAFKPFQRLQFLVRDWQNFDGDWDDHTTSEEQDKYYKSLRTHMSEYLQVVIKDKGLSELQVTREQIIRCFERVDCFLLPHPGFAVTKKNYSGALNKIEPFFRGLMNKYVRMVFDEELEPKIVNRRAITGLELARFFKVFALMFQTGTGSFPKAMTMLEATAEANNRNALDISLQEYKKSMDLVVGADCTFVKDAELLALHAEYVSNALASFDDVATMGPETVIMQVREQLMGNINEEKDRYFRVNADRNPFKDMEKYVLPLLVAVLSWVLATLVNATCSHDICESAEVGFRRMYLFILFGFLAVFWRQISQMSAYLKALAGPMLEKCGYRELVEQMVGVPSSHANDAVYSTKSAGASENERSVLIGNPGIGKSYFQYYNLARLMNPSLFGALPPDCFGSRDPPKFVIRQEGLNRMTVFDIEKCEAQEMT